MRRTKRGEDGESTDGVGEDAVTDTDRFEDDPANDHGRLEDDAAPDPDGTDAAPITGAGVVETFPGRGRTVGDVVEIPGRSARTVAAGDVLAPELADSIDHDLYTHQAEALAALDREENVCVATSTASGKTLVYGLQIARNYLEATENRRTDAAGGERATVHGFDGAADDRRDATAYVCYPTKALSRDQERELNDLFADLGLDLTVAVYDGDTETGTTRREIREEADVIISNFAGVNTYLHDHDRWTRFFRACELVVIDESHTYTGVHGMHVAWIIRRLKRVLEYYDADPQFVLTSATIGNPPAHSAALIDEPITVVDEDGSPRGPRDLLLWNPPPRDDGEGPGGPAPTSAGPHDSDDGGGPLERVPASVEAPRLFSHLAYHGAQTLLFAPSRKLAELSVKRARAHREDQRAYYGSDGRGDELRSYHAGHSRQSRHATEHGLKTGRLDGVASTNALELGINVGAMDATVQLGYPGQRQSFWQQIGRAGRGADRALSVLVADHRTLDQYVVRHPEYLLETDVEDAVVDTANDAVFAAHLRCAADELALTEADADSLVDRDRLERAVEMWRRAGLLSGRLETGVSYAGPPRPQSSISLYATAGREYEVRLADDVDDRDDPEMESLARERVFRDFHEGAVRLHEGRQYEVADVVHDGPRPHVVVRPTDVDYYTVTNREVTILDAESQRSRRVGDFELHFGRGTVLVYHGTYDEVSIEAGRKRRRGVPTNLPPLTMETQLCWLEVPEDVERALIEKYRDFDVPDVEGTVVNSAHLGYAGGLHAAEHATIGVAPLELMVDKRDLGGLATLTIDSHLAVPDATAVEGREPRSIAAAEATVRERAAALDREPTSGWFIYDGVEGGLGFSRAIYENFEAVAARARDLIADCECGRVDGCPACVMDDQCGNDNRPLHRDAAVDVLEQFLGERDRGDLDAHLDDEYGGDRRPTLFYA